jgi:hypothetical protein
MYIYLKERKQTEEISHLNWQIEHRHLPPIHPETSLK